MRSLMAALVMVGTTMSLHAQSVTIDPGMTREQVVTKLGEPLSARMYDGHTYLLYKNGCEKTCGMNDLVVLDSGKVVDAVFRAPGRKYSGTSSSPRMISQAEAKRGNGGAPLAMPAGEPKTPPKAPAKTAAPKPSAPVTKAASPAPTKTPPKAPVVTAPAKKTETAPAKTASPPPAPPKKTDAVQSNKAPTIPPPKTSTAAPGKKTEPAPPVKKPDSPPGKKPDSTKKPPAKPGT